MYPGVPIVLLQDKVQEIKTLNDCCQYFLRSFQRAPLVISAAVDSVFFSYRKFMCYCIHRIIVLCTILGRTSYLARLTNRPLILSGH